MTNLDKAKMFTTRYLNNNPTYIGQVARSKNYKDLLTIIQKNFNELTVLDWIQRIAIHFIDEN